MVWLGLGLGWAWVGAYADTWNGSPPPPGYVVAGYGEAWVGLGLGAPRGRIIKKRPSEVVGEPMRFSLLAWPYRPTPGLKAKPQGPRPNPSPPGVVAWAFSPTHAQTPVPYPKF
ncbi:hypothetical protein Hanom_Chr12g01150761 [Helianthus anomalus]